MKQHIFRVRRPLRVPDERCLQVVHDCQFRCLITVLPICQRMLKRRALTFQRFDLAGYTRATLTTYTRTKTKALGAYKLALADHPGRHGEFELPRRETTNLYALSKTRVDKVQHDVIDGGELASLGKGKGSGKPNRDRIIPRNHTKNRPEETPPVAGGDELSSGIMQCCDADANKIILRTSRAAVSFMLAAANIRKDPAQPCFKEKKEDKTTLILLLIDVGEELARLSSSLRLAISSLSIIQKQLHHLRNMVKMLKARVVQ